MALLTRLDLRGSVADPRAALALRASDDDPRRRAAVREIIAAVRERGDAAVREYTARFDGCDIADLRVGAEECRAAWDGLDAGLRTALEHAREAIAAYHEEQRAPAADLERNGVRVREVVVAVDRAGLYVPGGRAAYPSTVLMTAIPARVAGVPAVALCVPPGSDGRPPAATLAAAHLAGVDEVYRVGGAQAIAALAYGTETIAPVAVVYGPGNAYVALAKREVTGVVGTDTAGPSEVAVVADDTADPGFAAADLVAQTEHGPDGAAVLVTWSETLADAVDRALAGLVERNASADELRTTLAATGRTVLVDGPDHALAVTNALAPEHLELLVADPDKLVPLVRNAGAVFCGPWAPAVVGDYLAGVNHVLPTGRTARFASALRVDDFERRIHVVSLDESALLRLEPDIRSLAQVEGLEAHAAAVAERRARS
jgi:histidinol dehydrogenase